MGEAIVGTFLSVTGATLEKRVWLPEGAPRAVVQLVHGMAEHIARYDATAKRLNAAGFLVVGHTFLGHGELGKPLGWFAEQNGWDALVDDVHALRRLTQDEFPGLPYFILGHSMGSFLVRTYCQRYEAGLAGAVLSGTGHFAPALVNAGLLIAELQCLFGMEKTPSMLLHKMSFGNYNKAFEPTRTAFDWLSKDTAIVDRYVADPYCGFPFTAGGYRDFFRGLGTLSPRNLRTMDPNIPIRLFSGMQDPIGEHGEGVKVTAAELTAAGVKDVTYKLFENCRHETLNEVEREAVWADLIAWLEAHLTR